MSLDHSTSTSTPRCWKVWPLLEELSSSPTVQFIPQQGKGMDFSPQNAGHNAHDFYLAPIHSRIQQVRSIYRDR
jgi:hypothetical protein